MADPFSDNMSVEEKLDHLHNEFGIIREMLKLIIAKLDDMEKR
jgi:hypothetical protein